MKLLDLYVKVHVDRRGVGRELKKTEREAQATSDSADQIGTSFQDSEKKGTTALQKLGKTIQRFRKDYLGKESEFNIEADFDSRQAEREIKSFSREIARAGQDIDVAMNLETQKAKNEHRRFLADARSEDIEQDIDLDTQGATAKLRAWRAQHEREEVEQGLDLDTAPATAKLRVFRSQLASVDDADVNLDLDTAAANAQLAAFIARAVAVPDIHVDVDVDTAGATAQVAAFGATSAATGTAVQGMLSSVSGGTVVFGAIAAAIALAAAALTPLLGGLAAVGGLAAAAGAGFAAFAAPLGMVIAKLAAYQKGLEAVKTAQTTADASAQASADAMDRVADAEENVGRVTDQVAQQVSQAKQQASAARRNEVQVAEQGALAIQQQEDAVADAQEAHELTIDSLIAAEQSLSDIREDEPDNLRELGIAEDRATVARKQALVSYNQAVRQYGAGSLEAESAFLDLEQAEIDERRAQEEATEARKHGTEQLQAAKEGVKSARKAEGDAAEDVQDQEEQLAQTRTDAARANAEAARATKQAQAQVVQAQKTGADQIEQALDAVEDANKAAAAAAAAAAEDQQAVKDAMVELSPALMGLYNDFMRFKDAASSAFEPAMNKVALLGSKILGVATNALPTLGRVSSQVIDGMTSAWTRAVGIFSKGPVAGNMQNILGITPEVMQSLANTVTNVLGGLVNILGTAAPAALQLAHYIERITNAFLKWSGSERGVTQITAAISAARPVFLALWHMVTRVIGALIELGMGRGQMVANAIDIITDVVVFAIKVFGRFLDIIGPWGLAIMAMVPVAGALVLALTPVISVIGTLITVVGAVVGFLGGPLTIALAAFAIAAVLIWRNWSKIKPVIQPLLNLLKPLWRGLKQIGQAAKTLFSGGSLAEVFRQLPGPIQAVIRKVMALWQELKGPLSKYIKFVGQNFQKLWNDLKPVFRGIGNLARGAWNLVKQGAKAAFRFAIENAKIVVNWFKNNWPLIKETVNTVYARIKTVITAIGRVIRAVWNVIVKNWRKDNGLLRTIVQQAWRIIKTVVQTALRIILKVIKLAMQLITGDWKGAWKTFKQIVSLAVKGIGTVLRAFGKIALKILSAAWKLIKRAASAAWDAITDYIRRKIDDLLQWARNSWESYKRDQVAKWLAIYKAGKDWVLDLAKAISDRIEELLDSLRTKWEEWKRDLQAKWDAIKAAAKKWVDDKATLISNRIEDLLDSLRTKWESFKRDLDAKWNAIKDSAKTIWKKISDLIWQPIKYAFSKVTEFIGKITDAVDAILSKLGIGGGSDSDSGSGSGSGSSGGSGGGGGRSSRTAGGQPVQARARGGIFNPRDGGGTAGPGNMAIVGEAGEEESIVNTERYTPESASALRYANAEWARRGWLNKADKQHTRRHRHSQMGPNFRYAQWGGEGLGPTTHNWRPDVEKYQAETKKVVGGISTNTYVGHPGGEQNSVDHWAPGGRGAHIAKAKGDAVESHVTSNYPVKYYIWQGKIHGWGNVKPYTDRSDMHYDHIHVTYGSGNAPTGAGSGDGGFIDPETILRPLWERFVEKPIIDPILVPLENSEKVMYNIGGGAGRQVSDGIYDWLISKVPGTSDSGSGGTTGSSPPGLTADEVVTQGGWPDRVHKTAVGVMFEESSFIANNGNGTYEGLFAMGRPAMQQVGMSFNRVHEPLYNSTAAAKLFGQSGWQPWEAYPPSRSAMARGNQKITGYEMGGLSRRDQSAVFHRNEVVLPLDRPMVMRSAQAALGTDQLSREINQLTNRLIREGIHIADLGQNAAQKILVSGEGGAVRVIRSQQGRNEIAQVNKQLNTNRRIQGARQ